MRTHLLLLALPAFSVPAPAAAQGPPATAVRVQEVRIEPVRERRQVPGEVRAVQRSLVAAEEAGRVVEIAAREGERVAAGDVLARLDEKRLELELAALEARQASAAALLEERRSDLDQAERDLATVRDLAARKAANAKELADAETAREIAAQRVSQAEQSLAELEAEEALLRVRLEDMAVRAPYDGVVVARHADVGEWLRVGDPVAELVSASHLEAWLEVPQSYFASVRERHGDLQVRIDATDERHALAEYRVLPAVDPRARSFSVVAPLPEGATAAAGMSLTGFVQTIGSAEHPLVSAAAVGRNDAGTYVYTVVPGPGGGTVAAPVPVDVLWHEGGDAVLRAGSLPPGTQVVIEGGERLFPMAPVRVVEPGSQAGSADAR